MNVFTLIYCIFISCHCAIGGMILSICVLELVLAVHEASIIPQQHMPRLSFTFYLLIDSFLLSVNIY